MGYRKVQITGGGTYTVSLPKKWVQENSINKGDQVSVSVKKDNSILISPKEKKSSKKTKIKVTEDLSLIIRKFITKYLEGYDEIEIYTKNRFTPEFRKDLKETVQNLIGVEIFEETSKKMVFQTLVESGSMELNNMLRRLSVITNSMYSDSIEGLKGNFSSLDIQSRDDEIDKLHFYIRREINEALTNYSILNSLGIEEKTNSVNYILISKNYERIADYAVEISSLIPKLEDDPPSELLEYAEQSIEIYKECTDAHFRKDNKKANKILNRYSKIKKKSDNILKTLYKEKEGKNLVLYTSILDGIKSVIRHSTNIARVTINLST